MTGRARRTWDTGNPRNAASGQKIGVSVAIKGMGVRQSAEVWPIGSFIREEMEARGWDDDDILRRCSDPIDGLACLLITHVDDPGLLLDRQTATALGAIFGVSAEYWVKLDAIWRNSMVPDNKSGELLSPAQRGD